MAVLPSDCWPLRSYFRSPRHRLVFLPPPHLHSAARCVNTGLRSSQDLTNASTTAHFSTLFAPGWLARTFLHTCCQTTTRRPPDRLALGPTLRNTTAGTNDDHATLWDERQPEQWGSLKWLPHLPRLKFCLTGVQFYLTVEESACVCNFASGNAISAAAMATSFITWLCWRTHFSNVCLLWQCLGNTQLPLLPFNLLIICNWHEREGVHLERGGNFSAVQLYRMMAFMILSNLTCQFDLAERRKTLIWEKCEGIWRWQH